MSNEGLDLDELDVEVPTAAYKYWHGLNNGEDTLNPHLCGDEKTAKMCGDKIKELVRREGHREALEEAVQQARQRERRRILENLQTKLYQLDWIQILQEAIESRPSSWGYPDRNVETENGFDHPVIEWRNASDELISPIWNQLEEELEEEVEK